jgi:TolB-like protein/DNA-binding SARP family transcriptional activator
MYRLRLLGGASLEGPDGLLTGAVAQRQRLALLALVALCPTGSVSRDKLLALLWPESTGEKARHALSNALYMVKKELGEEAVIGQGEDLRLNLGRVSVDALDFAEAVEGGDLRGAVALYLGPFMDGVYLKESHEFDRWVDSERGRLGRLYGETLKKLADLALREGEPGQAVEWLRKLAAQDPFDSEVALALMEALEGTGRRAEAIQHAAIHATLLREHLEAEPDPSVEALAERMRAGDGSRERTGGQTPDPPDSEESETDGERGAGPERIEPDSKPVTLPSESSAESVDRGGRKEVGRPPLLDVVESPLFQWSLTYLAGAWFCLQAVDALADPWGLSQAFQRRLTVALAFGFPLTVSLAWFRSRKEARPFKGFSTLVLAVVLAALGMGLALLPGPDRDPLSLASSILRTVHSRDATDRPLPSIAVLPFDNISPNPEDAYLADGLHEELITQLSKISGLIVISRGSVMSFRGHGLPTPEVADRLNVGAILEGSIQKAGNTVRFTAQLIDGETDAHLWGDSFDRTLTVENLFQVQTEIALRIAEQLRTSLTPDERDRLSHLPTESTEAFDLYLRGRQRQLRYQADDNEQAIAFYRQALELDPRFALAWAGLSGSYSQGVLLFGMEPAWSDSALATARTSIGMDPNEAEGYRALGLAYTAMGRYRPALDAFMEALRHDPSHGSATANVGVMLMRFGVLDEALLWTRRSLEVNPSHPLGRANMAWNYLSVGELALAESWARDVATRNPEIAHAHQGLALLAAIRGEAEEALRIAEGIIERDPDAPARRQYAAEMALFAGDWEKVRRHSEDALTLALGGGLPPWHHPSTTLGFALLRLGREEEGLGHLREALEAVAALTAAGGDDPRLAWEMGCILVAEGKEEEGLGWLERGYDEGWRWVAVVELDPMLDPLRHHPRFLAIQSGMNASVGAMRQRARESEEAAGLR